MRKIILVLGALVLLSGCGVRDAEKPENIGEEPSSSPAALQTKQGDQVIEQAKKLPIKEEKQFKVIAKNWKQWNMSYLTLPSEDAEDEERMGYIDDFEYSVTDLDQDGYLEIMTMDQRGTGDDYTEFHVYEVQKDGKTLAEWQFTGADENPDWGEYPMDCYYDGKNKSWHYMGVDFIHGSASSHTSVVYDMEMRDDHIHMTTVKREEYDYQDDEKKASTYYDGEGREIDEDAYNDLEQSYYGNMEKYLLFWDRDQLSYELEEDVIADVISEMKDDADTYWMEKLWYGFQIRDAVRDSKWESKLSDSEKKQLRKIAASEKWYHVGWSEGYEEYDPSPVSYAVTDLDGDGQLEIIQSSIQGTGCYSWTYIYEVSEDGKLERLKGHDDRYNDNTKKGYLVDTTDVCNVEEVVTYWDEEKKTKYYIFEDYTHLSSSENYYTPMAVSLENNQWVETYCNCSKTRDGDTFTYYAGKKKVSEKEYNQHFDDFWKGKEKGTAHFGWREIAMGNLYRLNKEYLYQELVESYGEFCGE